MRPVVSMVMHIIRNLAEQNALGLQNPICLDDERRVGVRKSVLVLFRRTEYQAESGAEVLLLVHPLVGNVRWIVDDYIEERVYERHLGVVGNDRRAVFDIQIQSNHRPKAVAPK